MHTAEIIELFNAGLYGNGRLQTKYFTSGKSRAYLDILIKLPAGLTLRVVLRSVYSQDLKVNAG
jgi:hypothetical protein